jgi:hypothetical protein
MSGIRFRACGLQATPTATGGTTMAALDQGIATKTFGNDLTAHQLLVWSLFLINAVMIVITYLHVPVADLYHVSEGGFVGGLGRALVYANFPASLAALALIGIAVRRIRRSGMVTTNRARHTVSTIGIVAAACCTVTAVPGVVENSDLDAKLANVVPAIGVLMALGLTIVSLCFRERYRPLPWSTRDRIGLVIIAVLTVISLPWLLADLGIYIGDVPLIGRVFMSKEIPEGGTLHAVHLGHHHGLDGLLFVTTALILGRLVRTDIASRMASVLRGYFGLMFSYGLLNLAEDAWLEQIVKRGWAEWELPDVLLPELSFGWALILVGAVLAWLALFRPIMADQPAATPTRTVTGATIRV